MPNLCLKTRLLNSKIVKIYMSIAKKSILLIFLVLFIDQAVKIYVKLHFVLGEPVHVFDWFQIIFVENNGMAFGMEIIGKLFLTFSFFILGNIPNRNLFIKASLFLLLGLWFIQITM